MSNELDRIIDQVYLEVHSFLQKKLGKKLDHDLIDINLELTDENEIIIEVELYVELSALSGLEVQKVAEEAIAHATKITDELLPKILVNIEKKPLSK
ncbi:MAG: DUF3194 domain-containing protein [Candidatus Heimdallarchaeota archaeon]|nr:DUF3194 domain-containing protein [Candidatus Heimdallarchaeota archaeon]